MKLYISAKLFRYIVALLEKNYETQSFQIWRKNEKHERVSSFLIEEMLAAKRALLTFEKSAHAIYDVDKDSGF